MEITIRRIIITRINCCYMCKDREIGCHGKCKKYISLRNQRDDEIEAKYKENKCKYTVTMDKFMLKQYKR